MKRAIHWGIAWTVVAAGASAIADPVPISNHSFETPDLTSGNSWTDANPDWGDDAGATNDQFNEFIGGFAADGIHHVGLNAADTDGNGFVDPLFQDLSAAYLPNTIYTLTVAVGNRDGFTGAGNETIFRLADAVSGMTLEEAVVDASQIPVGTFEDRSLMYTTPASGGPVGNGIRIELAVGAEAGGRAHFDNIRLDAIPEPASAALLSLAGLGLALATRGRRCG